MEYENIIFRLDMLIPALPDRCSSEFLMPLLSGNGPSSYVCSQGCREFLPVQQLIARLDAISDSRPAGYELAVKGIFFELLFQILPQRQGSGDETAGQPVPAPLTRPPAGPVVTSTSSPPSLRLAHTAPASVLRQ